MAHPPKIAHKVNKSKTNKFPIDLTHGTLPKKEKQQTNLGEKGHFDKLASFHIQVSQYTFYSIHFVKLLKCMQCNYFVGRHTNSEIKRKWVESVVTY